MREALHRSHGYERSHELRDALRLFIPFVVERDGRISGYLTAATFWLMNHGVAETEQDMQALPSCCRPGRQFSFGGACSHGLRGGQADDADGHGQLPRAAADIETWRLLAAM